MLITRTSPFTGMTRTRDVAITIAQLIAWENGALAQNAFPQLSPGEREFIMTGITDEEWETLG